MKRWWIALLFVAIACTPVERQDQAPPFPYEGRLPEYVVLITPKNPYSGGYCTGSALAPRLVLTAHHCLDIASRVVTQVGQEVYQPWDAVYSNPRFDAAVLVLRSPLVLRRYAVLHPSNRNRKAYAYGNCKRYILSIGRSVTFYATRRSRTAGLPYIYRVETWASMDRRRVCGGDSGGAVVQDGYLVGMIHSVDRVGVAPALNAIPASDLLVSHRGDAF